MNKENIKKAPVGRAGISSQEMNTDDLVDNKKSSNRIEIYRITAELVSKILVPAVIVFVVVTFQPTINTLISKTTEAEFAGTTWKFTQDLENAVKKGDSKEVEKVFLKFRSDTSADVLLHFWKPESSEVDKANEKTLKNWMQSNGMETGPGRLVMFLHAKSFAENREKAIKELGLSE